jgi:hypothetical protein
MVGHSEVDSDTSNHSVGYNKTALIVICLIIVLDIIMSIVIRLIIVLDIIMSIVIIELFGLFAGECLPTPTPHQPHHSIPTFAKPTA